MTDFRYSLTQAPQPRNDGSGMIDHQIKVEYQDGEDWLVVPGRNKTFGVSAPELSDLLASGTTQQKSAAYKSLLVASRNNQASPVAGWDLESLQALITANALAEGVAVSADIFILSVVAEYPVEFTL